MKQRRRYEEQGMLAIDPKAFGCFFFLEPPREVELRDDVAIVEVRGPLSHRAGFWGDSYEQVLERVRAACDSVAQTVVLRVDSPGGDVSGCFETSRELRRVCDGAGKRLFAYADQASSGGYALASAAQEIIVPATGGVGSIGVVNSRVDVTAADREYGLRFAITVSGARKADGNPHVAISEGELAATQGKVRSLADVFYGLIEEHRGLGRDAVAALEADVFYGQAAVDVGLADSVQSFEQLISSVANGGTINTETTMKVSLADARKALEQAAESDDEKEAARAKKALAAMDEEETDSEGGDDEDSSAEGDDEESNAEGDSDDTEAEGDEEDTEASAQASAAAAGQVSAQTGGELAGVVAETSSRLTRVERQLESSERRRFLATRKDLPKELLSVLRTKPLAEVKAIVNAIPRPKVPAAASAAAAAGKATRGATQGRAAGSMPVGQATRLSDRADDLDREMGLIPTRPGAQRVGNKLVLGAGVPVQQGDQPGKAE